MTYRKHIRRLAAVAALAVIAPAQAQQGQLDTQREDQEARGIAPQQLRPDQIRQIQQALKNFGFFQGTVSGVWGPDSASALRRFKSGARGQSEITKLPQTNRIDAETLNGLGLDPAQFGQDTYVPRGATGRRGSGTPPSTSPGAPPSSTRTPGTPPSPGPSPSSPGGSR